MWVVLVKEILDGGALAALQHREPTRRRRGVPDGISTGHDGASTGVETLDLVLGQIPRGDVETKRINSSIIIPG